MRSRYTVAIWPEGQEWRARVVGVVHGDPNAMDLMADANTEEGVKAWMKLNLEIFTDPGTFDVEYEYEAYP